MEHKKNIYRKLLNTQVALKAPKNQYNKFGKYKYRNCEDILNAVKPILSEEGLLLYISDEVVLIGDRHYIKATVTIIDVDSEKELQFTALAREEETKKGMDSCQVTGAASSYARKYALNGALNIDDSRDSDKTSTKSKENPDGIDIENVEVPNYPGQTPPPPYDPNIDRAELHAEHQKPQQKQTLLTGKQIQRVYAIARDTGYSNEDIKSIIKKKWSLDVLTKITRDQYETLCNGMKQFPKNETPF